MLEINLTSMHERISTDTNKTLHQLLINFICLCRSHGDQWN